MSQNISRPVMYRYYGPRNLRTWGNAVIFARKCPERCNFKLLGPCCDPERLIVHAAQAHNEISVRSPFQEAKLYSYPTNTCKAYTWCQDDSPIFPHVTQRSSGDSGLGVPMCEGFRWTQVIIIRTRGFNFCSH